VKICRRTVLGVFANGDCLGYPTPASEPSSSHLPNEDTAMDGVDKIPDNDPTLVDMQIDEDSSNKVDGDEILAGAIADVSTDETSGGESHDIGGGGGNSDHDDDDDDDDDSNYDDRGPDDDGATAVMMADLTPAR